MQKQGTILIVDDNKNVLTAIEMLLSGVFRKVITIANPNRMLSIMANEAIDVVLLDMNFVSGINNGNEGLFWLSEIKKQAPGLPVVLFTAYADIELAVNAVKQGATDFVVKPWDNAKLVATLLSAYRLNTSRREVRQLREREEVLKQQLKNKETCIWGTSPSMKRVHELVAKVASTDANVLITGENGTGKEVVAREIHALSRRAKEVMVTVDVGALPESLFESELFGYVKGAFTDAREDRPGKFEAAHQGTLFLDEIGNLSYALQSKLLTAIQHKQVVRVGSNRPIDVDIRLICATNAHLQKLVEEKKFREDLLYRINTIHIEVPPLRERREDILVLADFFLQVYARKYGKQDLCFQPSTRRCLLDYIWPGNVRELQHAVEKAVIMSDERALEPHHFLFKPISHPLLPETLTLEEMEREMIRKALEQNGGNFSAVAKQLGITRQTLYNKIKKFNL